MGVCICKSTIIPKSVEETRVAIIDAIDKGNIDKLKKIFNLGSNTN